MTSSTSLSTKSEHASEELLLATLEAEKERRHSTNRLQYYAPYPKQLAFHTAGAKHRERLMCAGNQLGKTLAGGFEAAAHATGHYPDWWQGRRFDAPTIGWACGVSGEVVRDTVQRVLLGRSGAIGTGAIPKDAIVEIVTARGIADLVGTIKVAHVSGGTSIIGLKSYLAGREAFQGETLDWVWADEECDSGVYTELLTRTNIGNKPVFMTFTPLLGVSSVVKRFLHDKSPDRHVTFMTIDDVTHYTTEEKQRIIGSYPKHELEARTKGIPILGSGRIFPVEEERIACEHRDFPAHWPRIGGCDFGWDHPFAAVELVWDRDTDIVYVARCHRLRESTPFELAAALRSWGRDLRWAWPRDGRRETLEGAGIALSEQYRDQGLDMIHEHAQFEDGSVSVEAGLMAMLDRMRTGKLKVFKEHLDWWEEFRLYHRKDGKVVKEGDDLLCATRYALMMLRYARTTKQFDSFRRTIKYDNAGIV
jgi:phage terminase large subunit-like protein